MDERCRSRDNRSALWGPAKPVVVPGPSHAVSPGSTAPLGTAAALLSPFMLLVFVVFCSMEIVLSCVQKYFVWDFFFF